MKKLIAITTFVLFGILANSAMAKQSKLITLIGGPMVDGATQPWTCDIHNHTDGPIDTALQICVQTRDNNFAVNCLPSVPEETVLPERMHGFTLASGATGSAICKVEYLGQPGDILGTLCGTNGCVQLQPQ